MYSHTPPLPSAFNVSSVTLKGTSLSSTPWRLADQHLKLAAAIHWMSVGFFLSLLSLSVSLHSSVEHAHLRVCGGPAGC